ncbi:MAG: YlbL family protein [Microthrixaceae bacterium]
MNSADTPESLSSSTVRPDSAPDDTAADGSPGAEPAAVESPAVGSPGDGLLKRRRRRKWWGIGVAAVLLVGAVLGFLFVPTPYVLIQPGAVRPAEDRVEVSGAESYDSDGDIMFTTVYVDQATLFGLMRGSFDDAIEVRTEDEVYGDRGRDETREVNRQQMDLSKLIATMEALNLLGYESEFSAEGAHILGVAEDAPAASVLQPGDVIVAVAGNEVRLPAELREELSDYSPGDEVQLTIRRAAAPTGESASGSAAEMESMEVTATLTSAEASSDDEPTEQDGSTDSGEAEPTAVLGVSVEPWNPSVEGDVEVDIDSGSVTGPSAGLAWALAVVDTLTPESLTAGRDVAVTGEILADGTIGVIGGIEQKVSTVSRNGVEVFIYPADTSEEEQQEMRRIAGDKVELVPVNDLAEAVKYLSPGLLGDDN